MKIKIISLFTVIVLILSLACGCVQTAELCLDITDGVGFSKDSVYQKYGNDIYTADKPLPDIPLTFEAHIYVPKTVTANGVIFGNYDSHTTYSLSYAIKNGNPRVYWSDSLENTYDITFSDIDVRRDKYVHLAIVNDIKIGKILCYVDGVLEGQMSAPAYDKSVIMPSFAVGGDNRALNQSYFRGRIKSINVFSSVRTAREIKSDCKKITVEDKNLIAGYMLENTNGGGVIADQSANGAHLTYSNMWLTEQEMSKLRNADFERSFAFAAIGDTQYMSRYNPDKLPVLYNWLVQNAGAKNIKYAIGLGDITDTDVREEWDVAKSAIEILDGKIPYSLIRGNHDVKKGGDIFDEYFATDPDYADGLEKFESDSVANVYRLVNIGDVKFMIMSLDYNPSEDALAWASAAISAHPDYKVIVHTHAYLHSDGSRIKIGRTVYDKLIKDHSNIELVLCGHISDNQILSVCRGGGVTEMMIDAQDYDKKLGGLGMVAMMYFNSTADKFEIEYYSTVLDRYYYSENCFMVDLSEQPKTPDYPSPTIPQIRPEGKGTEDSPFLITEAGNLVWLSYAIKNKTEKGSFDGVYFKQINDIDLSGRTIPSIGNYYYASDFEMNAFGGIYDGGGYSIKNGIIHSSADAEDVAYNKEFGYGLFGVICGGTVQNLTLDNMTLVSRGAGGMIVGKAAGKSDSESEGDFNVIRNCTVTKTCKIVNCAPNGVSMPDSFSLDGSDCAGINGGIIGIARSVTIENCNSKMSLETSEDVCIVGGIAGSAGYNSKIQDCRFSGKIKVCALPKSETLALGGIVGLESPNENTTDVGDNIIGQLLIENCKHPNKFITYSEKNLKSSVNIVYR